MSSHAPTGNGPRWPMGLIASNGFGMFVLGIALALGGAYGAQALSRAIVASRVTSSISVKGSAMLDVRSDAATWSSTVKVQGATREQAYLRLSEAVERVQRAVEAGGFTADELRISAITTTPVKRRNDEGKETNDIEAYALSQSVAVHTTKVEAVEALSRGITGLIRDGVPIESGAPSYTISAIESQKMKLLDEATRNAMERARTLADGSGSRVGRLVNASQGVIQVLARGAIDGGEWGQYDTSTIDKTLRVVVSLEYAVE